MKNVIVTPPKNDSLTAQLLSLYAAFKNTKRKEIVNFELSQLTWVCPLLILPLSAYIDVTKSKYALDGSEISSYLSTIHFPEGIDSISVFQKQVQQKKSYIPISILKKEKGSDRERLETLFINIIYKALGSVPGAQSAIFYPILELVSNIFEHSRQDKGFIFGQFYPNKNYLDICIADCGRGLQAAYKQEAGLKLSDEEAVIEVMKGTSTKKDKERGYGVWTSKRIVCDVMGGEFILVSGSAVLISTRKSERLISLPNFYWEGVIVAYRIPKPKYAIDIAPYLE